MIFMENSRKFNILEQLLGTSRNSSAGIYMFELIRLMEDDLAISLLEKLAAKHKVRIKDYIGSLEYEAHLKQFCTEKSINYDSIETIHTGNNTSSCIHKTPILGVEEIEAFLSTLPVHDFRVYEHENVIHFYVTHF